MRFALALAVTAQLSAANAFAQTATFARTDYPFLGNDQIVFDVNRDGRMDMVGIGLTTARVMLGNGDGTFQPIVEHPVSAGAPPQAVAAGDFNRDGVPDLMVTLNDPQVNLTLITGVGDGRFNPPIHFANATGFDSPAIAAVDLDNDGNLDVVVGHSISCYQAPCIPARSITVMRGRGDGTFQAARLIDVGSDTAAIGVGDFNRDAFSDLVIASSSSRVHVLLGRGDGTFAQQTLTLIPENNIGMDHTDIDVADVNADLIDDVVVALSLNGSKTVILIGNGDGSFREPHFIQEPDIRIPHYQAVADYNGDGRLDLALSLGWAYQGIMEIRNGNGDGTFGPLVLYFPVPDKVQVDNSSTISSPFVANVTVTTSHVTLSGLPAQQLWWRVRARNSAGVFGPFSSVRRFTPRSAPAPASLSSVSMSPASVTGGTASTGTVLLTAAAPSGGAVVALATSQNAVVTGPSSVTVPAGATSAKFTATTSAVTASTAVTVSATYNSLTRSAVLTVNPPGQTATLTVSATGRSGERVLSSPSGISVSVGTTGSATFKVGTSITLSVTNGRDAIWSGACSSSGSKMRTCTFTLNGNAAVTVNVQ